MIERKDLGVAAVVVVAVFGAAWSLAVGGWPGAPSLCIAAGTCDCETLTGGLVQQPANTWSNLGFVVVGLWIIGGAGAGRRIVPANRMTTEPVYCRLFGGLAAAVGLGSMIFHASLTQWAGWVDLVPTVLIFSFLAVYSVTRLLDRLTPWFLIAYGAVAGASVLITLLVGQGNGRFVLAALLAVVVAGEWTIARRPDRHLPLRFMAGAVALYAAGGVLWLQAASGRPWCAPDGPLHGHALWHIFAAGALALVYRYLEGESID